MYCLEYVLLNQTSVCLPLPHGREYGAEGLQSDCKQNGNGC